MRLFYHFILFVFLSLLFTPTPKAIPTEVDDAVLYGSDSILLRANTFISGGTVVSGGNLNMGIGSEIVGEVYVTDRLVMRNQSVIEGDVFVGIEAILIGIASITGTLTEGFADFPEITIPEYEVTPGAVNVIVPAFGARVLGEGNYNNMIVGIGATLVLTGGTYQVNRFVLDTDSILIVRAPSVITAVSSFILGAQEVQFVDDAGEAYDLILATSSPRTSTIADNAFFEGILYAPYV